MPETQPQPQPQPQQHNAGPDSGMPPNLPPGTYWQQQPGTIVVQPGTQQGAGMIGVVTDGMKTFAGLPRDQIILLLVVAVTVAILGTGIYVCVALAPRMLMDDRNNWIRTNQEDREKDRLDRERDRQLNDQNNMRWMELVKTEGERNRQSSEAQSKQLYEGTLTISRELGKVQASNDRLEQTINKLNATIQSGKPPEFADPPGPDRCDSSWWERMLDGAGRDNHAPRYRGRPVLPVIDDAGYLSRDRDRQRVARRGAATIEDCGGRCLRGGVINDLPA